MSDITTRIRSLCPNHGDIAKLARSAGLAHTTVANWVKGRGQPQLADAARLAAAAGVRLEWLATGDGPRDDGDAAPDAGALQRIGRLRQAVGDDVAAFADRAGIAPAALSRALQTGRIDALDAYRVATTAAVRPEWLVLGTGPVQPVGKKVLNDGALYAAVSETIAEVKARHWPLDPQAIGGLVLGRYHMLSREGDDP